MRRSALAWLFLLTFGASQASAASLPPRYRFRSIRGGTVTVHYHDGLEALARKALPLAEGILEQHKHRYAVRIGRVQIVMSDTDDDPNGFASPLPYPLVWIRAAAPDGSDEFGNYETWLRLVLTHELAHVVHLEEARGIWGCGRRVFGRAPFLFPNTLTPTWMIEGLATFEETERTAFGRGRSASAEMARRMALLSGHPPRQDQATAGLDAWPGGFAPYLYGESFLRYESDRHGPQTLPNLARAHSGRPVPYLDDLTAKRVTGESFTSAWKGWVASSVAAAEATAKRIATPGVTPSRALTERGARQQGPRFGPDGKRVAYTSATLSRYREIRIVGIDGAGDRAVCRRNGGTGLTWSPDGRSLVFDETEVDRTFERRSDLRVVDVATGRVRSLTRGRRAGQPDVTPDGRAVVFVRRLSDRTELALVSLDGKNERDITHSATGTQWSHPRVGPDGRSVVAGRWFEGGLLDVVLVDIATGAEQPLTTDRAVDVEPAFAPDGAHVVFRSDRDGIPNLFAIRLADKSLWRATNVLGGAFEPDVAPDGSAVAFASYNNRGYDIHVADLRLNALEPAPPFEDNLAASRPDPVVVVADRPYRPYAALFPRFWSPFVEKDAGQWKIGAVTAAADPLLRHAYGIDLHRGLATDRFGFRGFYRYDRFRPTLLFTFEDDTDPEELPLIPVPTRTRSVTARLTLPLVRRVRSEMSLVAGWRGERQSLAGTGERVFQFGGAAASLQYNSLKRYPYSISPVDGIFASASLLREARGFGSDLSLTKLAADARAYARLGDGGVLAVRAGGGTTTGESAFKASFAAGGFTDTGLFDVVASRPGVLRGYEDRALVGRSLAYANAELRLPLGHPQRGIRSLPVFLRHTHAAAFVDSAVTWGGDGKSSPARFAWGNTRVSAGVQLGLDLFLFHALPVTAAVGYAHPITGGPSRRSGADRLYIHAGLAF